MFRGACLLALCFCLAAPLPAAETTIYAPGGCPVTPIQPQPDPARLPDPLVADLLDWIAAETAYDVAPIRADPPAVTFCDRGDAIFYEDLEVLVGDDIFGLYDAHRRRIVLVRPWDAADPRDRGVLLHELVHRVQLANRSWECLSAPEYEAYTLQARYLEQHGIDPGFDWLHIYFLSKCPVDIHPSQTP